MTNTWALCALWVGLALAATLLAIWFKISTALSEIVVGTVAQLVIGVFLTGLFGFAQGGLAGNTQWITFWREPGAIVLTFLAGAELDPAIFKTKWREASIIGLAGFFGPFSVARQSRITCCIGPSCPVGCAASLFRRRRSPLCMR
jgi:glutathione-regulated potassium-efflux system ancillary protein KefC